MGSTGEATITGSQKRPLHGSHGWDGWDTAPSGVAVLRAAEAWEDLSAREEWRLACRIAGSKGMVKSELLPRFLLHICELALRGRVDEITEQRIGMQIFNRPAGYNPGEDNIVRSYARTLRKRLDDYFANEGRDESLRISIPRGGYVPVFEPAIPEQIFGLPLEHPEPLRIAEEAPLEASPAVAQPLPLPTHISRMAWMMSLAGLIAGMLIASLVWFLATSVKKGTDEASAAHALWAQMFQANRDTLIVPADSGLGILENLSKRTVTVEQYANGSYLNELAAGNIDRENFADISRQRYTSVVDLNVVARLGRLPEYVPGRTLVRYVRGVTAEDIKSSNSILIGSKHTNPWVALFERSMNFTLEYTPTIDQSFIVNHSPRNGEQATYRNAAAGSSAPTYGVIAYLPSPDGAGHVLIVQGLNMAATEAAAEVLFQPRLIQPALQKASTQDGTLHPFELLVETSSVGAASPDARIIAMRIHPQ